MFSRYVLFSVLAIIYCSILHATYAFAQCSNDPAEHYRKETRSNEVKLLEAKQALIEKPVEEWTDSDQQAYLSRALWTVYSGMMTYILDGNYDLPTSSEDLVTQGYILTWPENPYNEWEPMLMLDEEDGFSAGNLCLLPAPMDYRDGKAPFAFELFIYGPDVSFARLGNAKPLQTHEEWLIIPEGALYMLGAG